MRKRAISLFLALILCLGLAVPALAAPAETNLPDWYFLFAIFKNVDADCVDWQGETVHAKYSMTPREVEIIRGHAREFEEYMTSTGVMRAHVDVVEIDRPVTELAGNCITAVLATPYLEEKVDLDKYDHVSCAISLNLSTGMAGVMTNVYPNGAGHATLFFLNEEHIVRYYTAENISWPVHVYVHEFLHVMEGMSYKWGSDFDLHLIREKFYTDTGDNWRACYDDIILNRVRGDGETGTGVLPLAWQYPPHVLRNMKELTVPSGVSNIGDWALQGRTALTRVTIPAGVAGIGANAFRDCTRLTEVNIASGPTDIGRWAFENCPALTRIAIPASVTSIGYAAFWDTGIRDVYYSGTEAQWNAIQFDGYNGPLTRANIHYNSLMADVKTTDWFAQPVMWALEKSVTNGTGGGKFSPGNTCTQGQILTFLWRAMGEPEPAGAVTGTKFYAKAAQWAKEQGLAGVNLDPDSPCTRADVVAYLWQLAGNPDAGEASFTDVPAGASYAKAVAWAVGQGITKGTSKTAFSPNDACTRGQIVTFLYRALAA